MTKARVSVFVDIVCQRYKQNIIKTWFQPIIFFWLQSFIKNVSSKRSKETRGGWLHLTSIDQFVAGKLATPTVQIVAKSYNPSTKSLRGFIFTVVCLYVCQSVCVRLCMWTKFQPNWCTNLDAVFVKWLLIALTGTLLKLVSFGHRSRSQWRKTNFSS